MNNQPLLIYNTLSRQKELFRPLHEGRVGMYVCGPTVYGDAHLGHARPAITFDLLFRYLQHLGYKVRYVRNITDVGHLEHDADEGEDKIAKKARLEELEPMEVAQYYTNRFHEAMDALNCLPPSIEPHATGHINTTNNTIMAYCPVVRWKISKMPVVNWLVWARSTIRLTSHFGRKPSPNISCVGHRPGAMVSLVGTASALLWDASIWAKSSIYTVEAWTSYSPIMNVRLPRLWPAKVTRWYTTGCTTI